MLTRRSFLSRLFEGAVLGTALALGVRPEEPRRGEAPRSWMDLPERITLHPEDFSIPAFVNEYPVKPWRFYTGEPITLTDRELGL